MKLWEIKAQTLKLIFADSELNFNYDEFADDTLSSNSNIKSYLTKMNDSIKRAIDLYYTYCGTKGKHAIFSDVDNIIDVSGTDDFDYPSTIDFKIYETIDEVRTLKMVSKNIDFNYDSVMKEITFDIDYSKVYEDEDYDFSVYYKMKRLNLPEDVSDLTFDLDSIYIPIEVQRYISYFVKAEVYEEDEVEIALHYRNLYIGFLSSVRRDSPRMQKRIKKNPLFSK